MPIIDTRKAPHRRSPRRRRSATPTWNRRGCRRCGLGPADAHIGATVRSVSSGDVVVLTSDPADIALVCAPSTPQIVPI